MGRERESGGWRHLRGTRRSSITTNCVGGGGLSGLRRTCRTWNSINSRGPGVGTLTGLVTRATAPSAETVEWAAPASVAELPANGAESWLATVPHTTLTSSDGN